MLLNNTNPAVLLQHYLGMEKFERHRKLLPVWFIRDVSDTCLSNRAKTVCLFVHFFYAQVHVCFQKCAEDTSRCVFRALLSLRVLMCAFPPALFGLSVTAVKHIPVWTAGRVHTLSINPPLRVHVLTCASVCLCVSTGRWVVDALFIATAIPLCHQYLICHTTCQRTMSEHPQFSLRAPCRG